MLFLHPSDVIQDPMHWLEQVLNNLMVEYLVTGDKHFTFSQLLWFEYTPVEQVFI